MVKLAPDLYPAQVVKTALGAFGALVFVERMTPNEGKGAEVVLSLHVQSGAPPSAIDELLDAMLRDALDLHLARPASARQLPRGL